MGNCFKKEPSVDNKYTHNELPTPAASGIPIPNDDFISSLCTLKESQEWFMSQENIICRYSTFNLTQHWACPERVKSIAASSEVLASGGRHLTLWNREGIQLHTLLGHERPINSMAIDSCKIVTGSSDYTLRVWDLNKLVQIDSNRINWNVITCVKWIPEEPCIIQCSEDLRLRIWDIREAPMKLSCITSVGDNFCTNCDIKDNLIATGHRGFDSQGCETKLWDKRNLSKLVDIRGHEQSVEGTLFINESLFTCSKDGKINRYNLKGEIIESWSHPLLKPFVSISRFGDGFIAANNEPSLRYFRVYPKLEELK